MQLPVLDSPMKGLVLILQLKELRRFTVSIILLKAVIFIQLVKLKRMRLLLPHHWDMPLRVILVMYGLPALPSLVLLLYIACLMRAKVCISLQLTNLSAQLFLHHLPVGQTKELDLTFN